MSGAQACVHLACWNVLRGFGNAADMHACVRAWHGWVLQQVHVLSLLPDVHGKLVDELAHRPRLSAVHDVVRTLEPPDPRRGKPSTCIMEFPGVAFATQ